MNVRTGFIWFSIISNGGILNYRYGPSGFNRALSGYVVGSEYCDVLAEIHTVK